METYKREYWIDILRGLSIFLVILNHWNKYVEKLQPEILFKYFNLINTFFGPYRMELLFFLSGLLIDKSLRKGKKKYYEGKIKALLYPYFLWGIFIIINNVLIQYFSSELSIRFIAVQLLRYFTLSYFLIWFIGFLFITLQYHISENTIYSLFYYF